MKEFKRKHNDYVETIFRDIGEAQFLYNQNLWLLIQIGWWRDGELQTPKTFGEKWDLFGLWSNPKNRWNTGKLQDMDPVPIIDSTINDEYVKELFKHTRLMRNLLTHFFHDENLKQHIIADGKRLGATKEYDGLMLFGCGEYGPEEVNDFFVATHNYYCKQLYNILCDYIDKEIEKGDPFRYRLSLRSEGKYQGRKTLGWKNLHPRWDFDKYTDNQTEFANNAIYTKVSKAREDERQQISDEIKKMQQGK